MPSRPSTPPIPDRIWPETVAWLEQRVAAAVSDTFVWTNERAQWLSEQVAEHFARDQVPLPVLRVDNTADVLDPVRSVETLDPGRLNPVQKVLIGMRGSYGGVLMFGLLTGIVGHVPDQPDLGRGGASDRRQGLQGREECPAQAPPG